MDDREALDELKYRLDTLLPEEYRDKYDGMQPAPMRSAGLKYAEDGTVAWDQMWQSFCDLAMAGGPPHKGALLQPGTPEAVAARPDGYESVVEEICRGIVLATELQAGWSPDAGWVRVTCYSDTMAAWLLRAITMENVSVRRPLEPARGRPGRALDLPAAPDFRLDKEIKNVITVVAKTSHYWLGHIPRAQKEAIAIVLASLSKESALITPERDAHDPSLVARLSGAIRRGTALECLPVQYPGWLGVACPSVGAAVWLTRASIAFNMLSRREGTTWFVPIAPSADPNGDRVAAIVARAHRLARASGTL